ncbi:hypothetical protein HDU83_000572 [Entophlyctis luteolus]|nr:hypothetical protein HDU83_000572 [Entophlyctis luteolus]
MNRSAYTAVPQSLPVDSFSVQFPSPPISPGSASFKNDAIQLESLNISIPVPDHEPQMSPISELLLDASRARGRLIKLVGMPQVTDPSGTHSDSGSGSESEDSPCLKDSRDEELPTRPPMVPMGFDARGRPIVDVIDSLDEDPFTLESFEHMIRVHAAKGKDFIIARVATVDTLEKNRFYYSYYSAHYINKVLFRTQPEEGLLHRMKAKNPLNNMVIVGDVHYYTVKAAAVNIALLTNKNVSPTSILSTATINDQFDSDTWKNDIDSVAKALLGKINRFLQLSGLQSSGAPKLRLIMRPEGLIDDAGEGSSIHDTRTEVAAESHANPAGDGLTILAHLDKFRAYLKTLNSDADRTDYCTEFEILRNRYQHELAGNHMAPREARLSSFVNDSGRANGTLTFEEWLKTFEVSATPSSNASVSSEIYFPPTLKLRKRPVDNFDSNAHATKITIESPVAESGANEKLYYVAEYFASDDDFLMKSAVRTVFRENALESDDAVLFTLPSSSQPVEEQMQGEQHPALRNFIYSIETGNAWLTSNVTFKIGLLLYLALGFLSVLLFGKCLILSVFIWH